MPRVTSYGPNVSGAEIVLKVLSEYTGIKLVRKDVDVRPDPMLTDVYAVRWDEDEFLITLTGDFAEDVEAVEEVQFSCWPPVVFNAVWQN